MKLDYEAINGTAWARMEELAREIDPKAKREGDEWVMNAHWRGEKGRNSLKANTRKRVIKDHASGDGFDPVKLWATHRGLSHSKAAEELQARFGGAPAPQEIEDPRKGLWIRHAPLDAKPPAAISKATAAWEVRDGGLQLIGYRVRFDRPEGRKEVVWYTWRRWSDGREGWLQADPDAPKPLYGLDRLEAAPGAPVIVCEGEKAADAAEALLPGWIGITSGSCTSASSADWGPLQGRRCVIWPDADDPGRQYASNAAAMLRTAGASPLAILAPPDRVEKGWDAADALAEGWTEAQALDLVEGAQELPSPEAEAQSSRLLDALLSADELLALRLPEREALFSGMGLTMASVNMLHARRGVGKTWASLGLAGALASGLPFLGWKPLRRRRVLVVDGELPLQVIQGRLRMLFERTPQGLDFLASEALYQSGTPLNLNAEGGQERFLEMLDDLAAADRWPDLIILDNRSSLLWGREANSNDAADSVLQFDLQLRHRGHCVLWIEHEGKAEGAGSRGASRNEDLMDYIWSLKAGETSQDLLWACMKHRGPVPSPAKLQLTLSTTWWPNGNPRMEILAQSLPDGPAWLKALVLIHERRPRTVTELGAMLGGSRQAASQHVAKLRELRLLQDQGMVLSSEGLEKVQKTFGEVA